MHLQTLAQGELREWEIDGAGGGEHALGLFYWRKGQSGPGRLAGINGFKAIKALNGRSFLGLQLGIKGKQMGHDGEVAVTAV